MLSMPVGKIDDRMLQLMSVALKYWAVGWRTLEGAAWRDRLGAPTITWSEWWFGSGKERGGEKSRAKPGSLALI